MKIGRIEDILIDQDDCHFFLEVGIAKRNLLCQYFDVTMTSNFVLRKVSSLASYKTHHSKLGSREEFIIFLRSAVLISA